ncbi:hypothetical protein [Massilia sp. Se16.2.3]|uniref:hypothetical protein n=1 Tax=Massilia sp. Se16.2.3 TaxID=2709303 RepID=UPI001602319D|nr:hypothetical protein G4G31_08465 [Massilia sp. Se16.2.3]
MENGVFLVFLPETFGLARRQQGDDALRRCRIGDGKAHRHVFVHAQHVEPDVLAIVIGVDDVGHAQPFFAALGQAEGALAAAAHDHEVVLHLERARTAEAEGIGRPARTGHVETDVEACTHSHRHVPQPRWRWWFQSTSLPPAKRFSTRASTNIKSDRRFTY